MLDREAPQLAPPGAGVSALQRWVGRWVLLPLWCRRLAPPEVPGAMRRQAEVLLALGDGLTEQDRVRRVLVPPQIGLEDSSRFHSWAMVLEHLTIVGGELCAVLTELTRGRSPAAEVRVEALKPRGGIGSEQAVRDYRSMLDRFERVVREDCPDWEAPARHVHPWFGPLGPSQWAVFGPFHQAIHVRQARRIRRRLDRA
jgi:hypothetical protein